MKSDEPGGTRKGGTGEILVPVDFSDGSYRALDRAMRLPLAFHATVTIVHVFRSKRRSMTARLEDAAIEMMGSAVARAERLRERLGTTTVIRGEVIDGQPVEQIVSLAAKRKAELIVIGRHGTERFADLLIGSTAERVVRHSATPVLIVRSSSMRPYRKPLIAVDLERTEKRAVETMLKIIDSSARTVDVVHGVEFPYEGVLRATGESEDVVRRLRERFRREATAAIEVQLDALATAGLRPRVTIESGDPRGLVLRTCEERGRDLLCLGTRGRQGVSHLLIGSVAEAIVRHAPCDVLIASSRRT